VVEAERQKQWLLEADERHYYYWIGTLDFEVHLALSD